MGMQIDGIAASQAVDTSAERIDIKGLDISSLQGRQGMFIYEHRHPDPKDKEKTPGTPHDLLGAILFAKKVYGPEDCEDDRQLDYWNQVGLPFLYIRGELFDGDGHEAARAMAAVIRFYNRNDIPCVMRFSIDGHTLDREGQELKACVARDVAITAKPCNHSCVSGVVKDPKAKNFAVDEAERHQEDGTERLPGVEFTMKPFETSKDDVSKAEDVLAAWAATDELEKAMAAGSYNQAPGNLAQGPALSKEALGGSAVGGQSAGGSGGAAAVSSTYATGSGGGGTTEGPLMKNRLKAAIRDWSRREPLRAHLEKTLRDVSPAFLEKFVQVLDDKVLSKAQMLHNQLEKAFDEATAAKRAPLDHTAVAGIASRGQQPSMPWRQTMDAAGTGSAAPQGTKLDQQIATLPHAFSPPEEEEQLDPKAVSQHMAGTKQMIAQREPVQAKPGAQSEPMPGSTQILSNPHVPGLRVGLPPGVARTKDNVAAAIRQQAQALRTPAPAVKTEVIDAEDLEKKTKDTVPAEPAEDTTPLTIRGQLLQPNPGVRSPHFDEKTGTLHTARGSFPMYIPGRDAPEHADAFHRILKQPKVEQFHNYALKNWKQVHEKLKAGKLPEGIVAHATLFSQLSPNTPVPMQELMFGHLVDYMRQAGVEPTDPAFGSQKHFEGWARRDTPDKFPQVSPEHWKRLESQLRIKGKGETDTGRTQGDIKAFQLAANKWKNMARYHEIHDKLVDAINRNRDDVRKTTRELLEEKLRGEGVPGLAPKTMRYTLGMMGGGNVVVPDTHFTRHLFGLDKKLDGPSIDYLKKVLWRGTPAGADTLEGIDRYYAKHHDAVRHLLEHPEHGKYFRDNPDAAIFPAFWKHWVSIVPHEKMRGLPTSGSNEFTDHRVFWDAIQPFLTKSEVPGDAARKMAEKTAMLHARWVDEYGEIPAAMMFYAYLAPHLMETPDAERHQVSPGSDNGAVSQISDVPPEPGVLQHVEHVRKAEQVAPKPVPYGGKTVAPGILRYRNHDHPTSGATLHVLGDEPDHYVAAVPPGHPTLPPGLVKVPKNMEGKAYDVLSRPTVTVNPNIVAPNDVHAHSRHNADLIAGLDLGGAKQGVSVPSYHAQVGSAYFIDGPQGRVFVKSSTPAGEDVISHRLPLSSGRQEAAYHNLAAVFGLQGSVPRTVTFSHPNTGDTHSAQEVVAGRHVGKAVQGDDAAMMQSWHDSGLAPRMAVMDHVLGNNDRHVFNYIVDKQGQPKLIDNGYAFNYENQPLEPPGYVHESRRDAQFAPDVHQWIGGLNAQYLAQQMQNHGFDVDTVNAAADRLRALQQRVGQGETLGYRSLTQQLESLK